MCDTDLSQMLHFAENDFLTALEGGTKCLVAYHQTWSTLKSTLSHDLSSAVLENRTNNSEAFSFVHFVASRISSIAKCYLDVKLEEESFASRLQDDCDAMLRQMSALDLNTQVKSLDLDSPRFLPASISNVESLSFPFPFAAYQWLLGNLHNPYPTATVKAQIAAASSCQISSINSWFINTRRRIGWTTLCRKHFSNCKADMIDAGYRAFVEEDPQRILSPELRHSFIVMKVAAEGLYPSALIMTEYQDSILNSRRENREESVKAGKSRQIGQSKFMSWKVRDSCPHRPIAPSRVPALGDSATGESKEDTVHVNLIGSKRRRSCMEPIDQPSTTGKPTKRLRASMTPQSYLPSPPSSTDFIKVPLDDGSFSSHSAQLETNEVLPSTKQYPSDVDTTGLKHPHGSIVAPHHHVALDPLPRSNMENELSIDDWFNNNNLDALFTIPPPVEAIEPDFSASWEVELFRDYNIPGKCLPSPTMEAQFSTIADLPEFNTLLQSIANDTFVTPFSDPYMVPSNESISDMSHMDWTSLFNGSDTYQSAIRSASSQYPANPQSPLEINTSMSQLPPARSQADFALKQAKLDQLYAMQEAVRRMEEELQSEGVIT